MTGALSGYPHATAAASAHAGVKSYSPKPGGAAVRHLSAVRIAFKARITDGNLVVRTAAGGKVSRASGRVVGRHRQLRARLKPGLRPGRYAATARWLNTDGHVETESWSFRLR